MKLKIVPVVFIFFSIVYCSCQKSLKEKYPQVRIISVDHDSTDETLTIVGEIVSDGGEEIESAGFNVSASPDFYITDVLSVAVRNGSRFEYTYYFLETERDSSPLITENTLYVYAYAVNKYGFGVSEVEDTD